MCISSRLWKGIGLLDRGEKGGPTCPSFRERVSLGFTPVAGWRGSIKTGIPMVQTYFTFLSHKSGGGMTNHGNKYESSPLWGEILWGQEFHWSHMGYRCSVKSWENVLHLMMGKVGRAH